MERKLTFNEVPELYDQYRPSYPEAMIEDIIRISKLQPNGNILEIGCGTGQATLPFAQKGYSMTCLDIGDNTIRYVQNKMKSYANTRFIQTAFEEWVPIPPKFNLIISGSAFHWIPSEVGYPKVANLLEDTGFLAFFWNMHYYPDTDIYWDIKDIYHRVTPELAKSRNEDTCEERINKRVNEINQTGLFHPVQVYQYPWEETYNAEQYVQLMDTFSDHRILDPLEKQELYSEVKNIINQHGGSIIRPYRTTCYITSKL